tara:strand:+ start:57 stop:506 length:450 start_codon:yes stop_codon:yes gene_type:complete
MSKIKTFKGQLPIGEQERIRLSTNDGLTGYKIKNFQIISSTPGASTYELLGKIYLSDQTGKISSTADLSETDLIAAVFQSFNSSTSSPGYLEPVILDKEMFNQDIYVYIVDVSGNTIPASFYIELEQFKIDINTSTYQTLKNLRSNQQL